MGMARKNWHRQLKLLWWSYFATVAHLRKMDRLKNSEKCPFPHQQNQEQLQRNPAVLEKRCCRGFCMHPRWNCATVAGKRQMASNISLSGKVAATCCYLFPWYRHTIAKQPLRVLKLACLKKPNPDLNYKTSIEFQSLRPLLATVLLTSPPAHLFSTTQRWWGSKQVCSLRRPSHDSRCWGYQRERQLSELQGIAAKPADSKWTAAGKLLWAEDKQILAMGQAHEGNAAPWKKTRWHWTTKVPKHKHDKAERFAQCSNGFKEVMKHTVWSPCKIP